MAAENNMNLSIYKSRKTLVEFLTQLKYEVKEHLDFSINEIDAMYRNKQLDMLLTHEYENKKVYIKYYLSNVITSKQIRQANLNMIVEDLYEIDTVLTTTDTLVIVTEDPPNDTILEKTKTLYEKSGIFVVIFGLAHLQFNLFQHALVPAADILTPGEKQELATRLHLHDLAKLPEISRYDPMAQGLLLRPGDVVRCKRASLTALTADYYRICV